MVNTDDMTTLEAPDRKRVAEPAFPDKSKKSVKGQHRRGGRLLALAGFLLLCAALAYGGWQYSLREKDVATTTEHRREFVPKLRTATVAASPNTIAVSLPATTLAFAQANMFARVSGYIQRRNVDIGDRVKKGQLLVQIYAPEIEHQISQAEAQLAVSRAALVQAQANRDLAQITWDRDKPLVEKGWLAQQQGSVDQQTLKAQIAAVGVAQSTVNSQEAQLKILTQQRDYQQVTAPFDGIVTQRNVDVGDLVQGDAASGTFMFTVMRSDVIRTQVFVPQDQAIGLAPGVDADVRVPEIPSRTFAGSVTRIANALQPGSRTLLTEIDVPNPDGVLTPGMYCTVELKIPRKTLSLLVPAQAVIFDSHGMQVAVVVDGAVSLHKIAVVRDFGTQLEVNDGVKQGDRVILNPPAGLTNGSPVRVADEAPAAPPKEALLTPEPHVSSRRGPR
jgi:RND family efflux transporter MFP subunit